MLLIFYHPLFVILSEAKDPAISPKLMNYDLMNNMITLFIRLFSR